MSLLNPNLRCVSADDLGLLSCLTGMCRDGPSSGNLQTCLDTYTHCPLVGLRTRSVALQTAAPALTATNLSLTAINITVVLTLAVLAWRRRRRGSG